MVETFISRQVAAVLGVAVGLMRSNYLKKCLPNLNKEGAARVAAAASNFLVVVVSSNLVAAVRVALTLEILVAVAVVLMQRPVLTNKPM